MNANQVARIAALVGEPTRTQMLLALMDGRALTALELARTAHVTAQTASRHLAQLVDAGLLKVDQSGRHRYHRLASRDVAHVLESIMQRASQAEPPAHTWTPGPRDAAMRTARTCYDHLAGRLGVAITDRLLGDGAIVFDEDCGSLTDGANAILAHWGLPATSALPAARKRALCRLCLDWSERRAHLAGSLGALLCSHCLEQGWLMRRGGTRALQITPKGTSTFRNWLGLESWERVCTP